MNNYYTYTYLRTDGTPYYIGKGKGARAYSKQKAIKPPKDKSHIVFLYKDISEKQAFAFEIFWIAVYGRKDKGTGILHNKTDGGEGVSGLKHSDSSKQLISCANTGLKRPWVKCSKEKAARISATQKGRPALNNGSTHTDESKRKMREAAKTRPNNKRGPYRKKEII